VPSLPNTFGTANYNGRGERVSKVTSVLGSVTQSVFAYDELGQLVGDYDPVTGARQSEYIYLDGTPVGLLQGSSTLYYVETDQLSTPRVVVQPGASTSTDSVVWKWAYLSNAFGENVPSPQAITFNLRFPGQYYDAGVAQHYNYFRDYEPGTGRYVESDPIGLFGGSYSSYVYASGSPLIYIDPFGLCWIYYESTGTMLHVDSNGYADYAAKGYAGIGAGYNNPDMQGVKNIGPLPQGGYTIQPQKDNITNGPHKRRLLASMRLTPNAANEMYERYGFLIHGPHDNDRQDSSNGCPIFSRNVRDDIGDSGDNCLRVRP
jgi:RHS repeat-associated protein